LSYGVDGIHGLVVDEDNVESVQVLFQPDLASVRVDAVVEKADLEDGGRVVDTVGHVAVAQTVAHQDDVPPGRHASHKVPAAPQSVQALVSCCTRG